jgi:hypothetical protein
LPQALLRFDIALEIWTCIESSTFIRIGHGARVTVRRAFGAYEIGRAINPSLATSQCIGGMIGGIGMTLMDRLA